MPHKWQDKVSPTPKVTDTESAPPAENEVPAVIMLVKGEDTEGNPQWAYAKIPAQNFAPFKEAEEKGNYSLADFGEIIKSGRGKEPPASVKQEMKEKYGCDENFEDSLADMMGEAIAEWDKVFEEEDKAD